MFATPKEIGKFYVGQLLDYCMAGNLNLDIDLDLDASHLNIFVIPQYDTITARYAEAFPPSVTAFKELGIADIWEMLRFFFDGYKKEDGQLYASIIFCHEANKDDALVDKLLQKLRNLDDVSTLKFETAF